MRELANGNFGRDNRGGNPRTSFDRPGADHERVGRAEELRELRRGIGQAEAGRTLPLEEVDRILMWSQGS